MVCVGQSGYCSAPNYVTNLWQRFVVILWLISWEPWQPVSCWLQELLHLSLQHWLWPPTLPFLWWEYSLEFSEPNGVSVVCLSYCQPPSTCLIQVWCWSSVCPSIAKLLHSVRGGWLYHLCTTEIWTHICSCHKSLLPCVQILLTPACCLLCVL